MRVLIATKIFPSARNPSMAPYNRHQFVALSKLCEVELFVSHPWFPGETLAARLRGKPLANVEAQTSVDGFAYRQARVFYLPKIGQPLAGVTYAASLVPHAIRYRGRVDVVLGAFAYPDGFAAVLLARLLGVPAVIKLHGSDVNLIGDLPSLKPLLSWALGQAYAVVGPSQALVDRVVELGANPETSRCIFNGVDKQLFHPQDRDACRQRLGIRSDKRWVLFIGLMVKQKGAADVLTAFRTLCEGRDDVELVMVGDGPELEAYRAQASDLPVRFAGKRSHEEIATWVGACDVVTLPSWAEGTPNVVIEALVSGRPVVASDVGGIPAVLNHPPLGERVPAKQPDALAGALARVLDADHDPEAIAKQAGFGDWSDSARALYDVLERAACQNPRRTAGKNADPRPRSFERESGGA